MTGRNGIRLFVTQSLFLGVCLAAGCRSAAGSVDVTLSEIMAEVADTTVVRVGVAPLDIGKVDNHRVTDLRPDLDFEPAETRNVIDVATFGDGRVALLTPDNVQLFSHSGEPVATLGRVGSGPGEFRYPVALAVAGDTVAVLQMMIDHGELARYDARTGRVLGTEGVGEGGDWMEYMIRGPALFQDFPAWSGVEDWSRRLGVLQGAPLLFVQNPEPPPGREDSVAKGPGVLLRLAAEKSETVAVLGVPPSHVRAVGNEQRAAQYWEQLYESRPLWAAGPGWWGLIERGDSVLEVQTGEGHVLRFAWPARRQEVTLEDRTATSRYGVTYVARTSVRSRARFQQMPRREMREQYRKFLTFFPFARTRPQAAALFHAGACALVAGFDPEAFTDGTATAWLRVSVQERRVLDVIRVRALDARTLHADGQGVYLRVFGEDDLPLVRRWRFPDAACETSGGG